MNLKEQDAGPNAATVHHLDDSCSSCKLSGSVKCAAIKQHVDTDTMVEIVLHQASGLVCQAELEFVPLLC